jgi:hypothetical protein
MRGARPGATRHEALRGGAEDRDRLEEYFAHVADEQHQPGQQSLHQAGRVGSIASARPRRQVGLLGGRRTHQGRDVVDQDLGRDVDEQRLLRQARDGFEVQAMLEPLEGLFDASTPVVEVGELLRRELRGVQVGDERANLAIGRDLANQTSLRRLGRTAPVAHITGVRRAEHHACLGGARAQERPGGAPATVVVAAHDEADRASVEQGDEPSGRMRPANPS